MAGFFGSLWGDAKRDVFNPVSHAAGNVVHALAPSTIEKRVIKPVATTVQRDVIRPTTNFVSNEVAAPVQRDFVKPVLNLPQTVHNDFVSPINRDFVQPALHLPQVANRDIFRPTVNLIEQRNPGFAPVMHTVGSVLGRTGVGLAQTGSGLYDMASQHTLNPKQTSFDKTLNRAAVGLDTYAKKNHVNPLVYRGGQVAANLIPIGLGADAAKVAYRGAEEIPKVGRATQNLMERGAAGRIAAKTIRNAANPKLAGANAAFTGYTAGQQAAKGQKVTPLDTAANFGLGQLGLPLAGATAHEAAQPVLNLTKNAIAKSAQALHEVPRSFTGVAEKHPAVMQLDDHLGLLRKADDNMAARGLSPNNAARIANRKAQALTIQARNEAMKKIKEGGYLSIGGNGKLTPEQYRAELKKRLQAELEDYRANQQHYRAKDISRNTNTSPGTKNSATSVAEKLFKEYEKNPDKFIDKYGLMPPELTKAPSSASRALPRNTKSLPSGQRSAAQRPTNTASESLSEPALQNTSSKPSVDPLAALKQEALKYKSADEFVNNLPTHGAPAEHIDSMIKNGYKGQGNFHDGEIRGMMTAGFDSVDKNYGKSKLATIPKPDAKVLRGEEAINFLKQFPTDMPNRGETITQALRKGGYDAIAPASDRSMVWINPDKAQFVKLPDTKQQLTDLYNQAHAETRGNKTFKQIHDEQMTERALQQEYERAKSATPLSSDELKSVRELSNEYIEKLQNSKSLEEAKRLNKEFMDATSKYDDGSRQITGDYNNVVNSVDDAYMAARKAHRSGQAHAEAKAAPVTKKASSPRKIGKALGLTDKQMAEANRADRERQQVSQDLSGRLPLKESKQPKSRVANSANLPKNRQDLSGLPKSTVKRGASAGNSSGGKYTTNATKVNIAEVKPGDYEKVRSNAQLVQTVVHNHAQSVIHALRQLSKAERSEFWHKVEDPNLPRSAKMQTAIDRWQRLADTVHATSHALGGDTPYRVNYARHNWDLSDPAQRELYEQLLKQKVSDTNYNPENFKGLDNKPRAFDTIKEGEAAGFKLKSNNPIDDIVDYANKSKRQLKTQAIAKGMQEAEENIPLADKSETQSIGYKKSIETTKQGVKELRALFPPPKSDNGLLKRYRALNHGAKRVLLGISQFHPININMQAAPALALRGHPIMAVRGLIDSAAALNKNYSDKIMENALKDGTMEDAARIGTPIATGSDFATGNKVDLKAGFGERAVFERQLPAMHIQMVKGVVADLKKRGISLDSPEARKAGTEINQIMGYVNTELRNLSPTVQRGLGDVALAPQFTRSKWEVLGDAFNPKNAGTLQGKYARDAVVGKYAAEAAITLALGALLGQKSDNITDTLIRTLIHPAVPTPFKDKKGNTIELGLPQNYLSEAAGLGLNYTRGKNGRLQVSANLNGVPGNLKDYGKNRLAILPNDTLKVLTNTDFADKPLYNPTSSTGDKIAQGATTLLTGHLPIGLQGLAYTKAVNKHLPQNIQDVLNNASPGSNPILKSVGSSFGLNPRTDKTVGKGLSTSRYFGALDEAKHGLNRQAADAIDIYTGGKKNPVTGKYDITPNANDSRAKATVLLQNPSAIDHLIKMNQTLSKEGEKVDPLWLQSKQNITKYLQYQAMPPASADKTDWINKNKWYSGVAKQRDTFFNSLPSGDPNKPKNPYAYPEADAQTQKDMDTYSSLTNSDAKGTFLDSHPNLIKQWDAIANYNNELRAAQGYAPLKNYPEPDANTQKFMDTYNAADKATRKSIRNANPTAYHKMIAFYDKLDLYNINKQGALGQLQGEPDYTNKSAKAIKSIGEDFYVDQNGNYHLIPAGWMLGLGSGSSSGGSTRTPAQKFAYGNLKILNAAKPAKYVTADAFKPVALPRFVTPPTKKGYVPRKVSYAPTVSVKKAP